LSPESEKANAITRANSPVLSVIKGQSLSQENVTENPEKIKVVSDPEQEFRKKISPYVLLKATHSTGLVAGYFSLKWKGEYYKARVNQAKDQYNPSRFVLLDMPFKAISVERNMVVSAVFTDKWVEPTEAVKLFWNNLSYESFPVVPGLSFFLSNS